VRLEGVLGEERAKSEYLFAEVGVLREQVVVREAEVAAREADIGRLQRQMSALDNEVTRLAIAALQNQDAAARLGESLAESQALAGGLKWAMRDVRRFTDSRLYRVRRKLRLLAAMAFSFKRRGVGLRRDVIPLDTDPEEFVSMIRNIGVTEEELRSRRPDLHELGINPFVHYLTLGRSENGATD
jgi:multidrug efflux pump subunit AcrA (membrane-fusion protein)